MKYCGRFSNKINMQVFDEISIIYDRQDEELLNFLQQHSNQTITLIVTNIPSFYQVKEWEKLNLIKEKYPEYQLQVCFLEPSRFNTFSDELQACIKELQIPFFTGYLAVNFDQLHYLCQQGVCEVYICEELGFDLKRAKAVADKYGAKIRTFPNVAQASVKTTHALKKFFIRPEDVEEYSDVIDTLEFWGDIDRQGILLKIYKKGVWFGDLQDLIFDLDFSFDSKRIVEGFAKIRKSCARKCMKGGSCSACDHYLSISEKLKEKNLYIKYPEKD